MNTRETCSEVLVVIVTYNGALWIIECLKSVAGLDQDVKVLVIDNASTDNTVSLVNERFPSTDVIVLRHNLGFGVGNNIGLRKALDTGSKYVLLLNQDAFMAPGSLHSLRQFMDSNLDIGICSPMQCSPNIDHIDPGTHLYYLSTQGPDLLNDAIRGQLKESYRVQGLNAAVWFIRAETLRTIGGFDPLYFMYGEDDDWLERMRYHKVPFALLPRVDAVHLRQSPKREFSGLRHEFRRRTSRSRASILKMIKYPGYSAGHAAALVIAHGIIRPIADVIIDRQWLNLAAVWAASLQIAFEFPKIRRHTLLTRTPGAHFLTSTTPKRD